MTKVEEFKTQMLTILPSCTADVKPYDKEVVNGEGKKVGAYPIEVRAGNREYGVKVLLTNEVLSEAASLTDVAKMIGRQIKFALENKGVYI